MWKVVCFMKAEVLKRLFSAVSQNDMLSLYKILESIIADEKDRGHQKLSNQLKSIYDNRIPPEKSTSKNLNRLPRDQRTNAQLVTYKNRSDLMHHMVLPDSVEKRFQRIENEYSARKRLALHNLEPRKKILLYGPPGCGKTLGAERLAWNTGLTLMKVKFDTLISSFLGESAVNLRKVFEASREGEYLLLLDECDFIAKARNYGQDVGEVPRIVNMLLMLLDEYEAPGLLVATTNLESSLDRALFRRFDDVIEVVKPGEIEKEDILKMTMSAIDIGEVNWDAIVSSMNEFSASNVVSVAKNSIKQAILEGNSKVLEGHISQAISEVIVDK